jgi:hypothetical protein
VDEEHRRDRREDCAALMKAQEPDQHDQREQGSGAVPTLFGVQKELHGAEQERRGQAARGRR